MTVGGPAQDGESADGRELVDVELTGTTLRTTDIAGNTVSFDLTGWDRLSDPHEFDEPIDAVVVGRVSEIRYDLTNMLQIDRLNGPLDVDQFETKGDGMYTVGSSENVRFSVDDDEYYCRFDDNIFTRLRFDGAATIRNRSYGELSISFSHPTPVTFGFKSTVDVPRHRLTVEPTTTGIARAISHMASATRTTSPDRVHRNYRGYPPLIDLGEETEIPTAVRDATPETGLELLVPDRLDATFSAASLVYYLGARLRPADVTMPVLRAESVDLDHELAAPPAFGTAARDLLRRTFFLDLMASWTDEDEPTVKAYERLLNAGISLEDCADAPIAERVATYLDLPDDPVEAVLPSWPYRMTVEPVVAHVSALPHLLHDMAAIEVPNGRERDQLAHPTDHERLRDGEVDGSPSNELADDSAFAELRSRMELYGTLGDVDGPGFTALPVAYENRLRDLEREREPVRVTVVACDVEDVDAMIDAYAARTKHISPIVDGHVDPSGAELADLFAEGPDFIHVVGQCEDGGIVCRDGVLQPSELAENRVPVCQLDGPNSRAVARELVEAGCVAAVARPTATAETAGSTTVGQLVMYGQSVATAASCGCLGQNGDEATVVGDGAHRFVSKWRPVSIQSLTSTDDGRVRIAVVPFPVDPVGTHWVPDRSGGKHLMPATFSFEVEPEEFSEYFSSNSQPVYVDGRYYWMDEQRQLIYPIA